MSESEHRRDPRITRSFMVRYRAKDTPTATWSLSPLRDLSGSGARFICEATFSVGTVLELQLLLPQAKKPLPLLGRVAWTKPGPLNLAEHGVIFEAVDAVAQQRIEAAVTYFLRKERPK